MKNILTIAHNTFRETIRDRILFSALIVSLLMLLFTLFIGSISIGQEVRMIIDFGITVIFLLQIFVAIFMGSMLIYKEIEHKTFFLIIPKPIKRHEIILGKCLGLTGTTFIVTVISTLALLLILFYKGGNVYFGAVMLSVFLSTLEASLLILISMLFASFVSPVLATICTVVIFLAGHSGESLRSVIYLSKTVTHSTATEVTLGSIYYLLPNLEKFNLKNEIIYNTLPSFWGVMTAILYFFLYAGFVFALTLLSFKKKEF